MVEEQVALGVVGALLATTALVARSGRRGLLVVAAVGLLAGASALGTLPADASGLWPVARPLVVLGSLALLQALLTRQLGPHPRCALWAGSERASAALAHDSAGQTIDALLHQHALGLISPLGSPGAAFGWALYPTQWLTLVVPPAVVVAAATWRAPGPRSLGVAPWSLRLLLGGLVGAVTLSSGVGWLAGRGWGFIAARSPLLLLLAALTAVAALLEPASAAAFVAQVPWPPGVVERVGALTLAAVALRPDRWLIRVFAVHGTSGLGRLCVRGCAALGSWAVWWALTD